jgi:NodT family efflux transporter outer membrane factor (OMF) lipoprotein
MRRATTPSRSRVARLSALPAAVALACVGCTVGPDYRSPDVPTVPRYTSAPAEPVVALPGASEPVLAPGRDIAPDWWTLFGSPAIDTLVARALASSPTLAQANARLLQAEEERNARTGATEYPAVNATAGVNRQRVDPATFGFPQAPVPGPFTTYSVGIQVSYTFDLFGGTRRELEALAAEVDYQRYELEAARLTLAANVAATAIRRAGLSAQIDATQRIVAAQRRQLEIVAQRYELGGVALIDLENRRALLAQTESALPPLVAAEAQATHLLAVYTGAAPGDASLPAVSLSELRLPAELPLSLPSQLARQRPDIRASEALLQKANANVGVATANLYPRITLSASATPTQLSLSDLASSGLNIWSIGANLLQPVFRGGELTARKRAAVAVFEQAEAAYRDAVLQGLRNVADVLRALESDTRSLASRSGQAEHAENVYRIAQGRYDDGGMSQLDVLDAERQRLSAALARVQAETDRYADTVALLQALGGGWWNAAPPDQTH